MVASKGCLLRAALKREQPLLAMGAFDAMTARMVERAGFRATYIGSFATAASVAGLPDFGLLSATEMADQIFEHAGVAAIQLEDQVSPKKCGHIADKDVIPRTGAATIF